MLGRQVLSLHIHTHQRDREERWLHNRDMEITNTKLNNLEKTKTTMASLSPPPNHTPSLSPPPNHTSLPPPPYVHTHSHKLPGICSDAVGGKQTTESIDDGQVVGREVTILQRLPKCLQRRIMTVGLEGGRGVMVGGGVYGRIG